MPTSAVYEAWARRKIPCGRVGHATVIMGVATVIAVLPALVMIGPPSSERRTTGEARSVCPMRNVVRLDCHCLRHGAHRRARRRSHARPVAVRLGRVAAISSLASLPHSPQHCWPSAESILPSIAVLSILFFFAILGAFVFC